MHTRSRRSQWQVMKRSFYLLTIIVLLLGQWPVAQAAKPTSVATTPSRLVSSQCQAPSSLDQKTVYLPLAVHGINQQSKAVAQPQRQLASTTRQLKYQVGKTYVYQYDVLVNSKSSSRDAQGVHDDSNQTTVINAFADVAIQEQQTDGLFVGRAIIREPLICNLDGGADAPTVIEDPTLVAALQQPIVFKQKPDGTVTEVAFPANAPVTAVNMQKGLINALQVKLNEGSNSYTAEENGVQGRYNANYTLVDLQSSLQITKTFDQNSFISRQSAGDQNGGMQTQTRITVALDAAQGIFSSIKMTETVISANESQNPPTNDSSGLDGLAVWSTINTQASLLLQQVTNESALLAASLSLATYVADDLGADLSEAGAFRKGIDLTTVNLDNELATLEQDPQNPTHVGRVIDLVQADDQNTVLNAIGQRVQQTLALTEVVAAYIDVLVGVGTPAAQEVLDAVLNNQTVQGAQLTTPYAAANQEHALIGLVLLNTPTITTVNTVQAFTNDETSLLHDQAFTVLGAAADALSETDPTVSAAIVTDLSQDLLQAQNFTDTITLIEALGNTGSSEILDTIQDYLAENSSAITDTITDTASIRLAALDALRKVPDDTAESLLVSALNDPNEVGGTREHVATLLADRQNLSQQGAAALEEYVQLQVTAKPGEYERTWDHALGGRYAGVTLPGSVIVKSPPKVAQLYLSAIQEVNAHVWEYEFALFKAKLEASTPNASGSVRQLNIPLWIGGNYIRANAQKLPQCKQVKEGTLYDASVTFFNVTYSIPIFAGLTVDLNVKGTGNVALNYRYDQDLCTANSLSATGSIIPEVRATVSGSASVNAQVVRGGGTLDADLITAAIPGSLTATYNGSSLAFCVDIRSEAHGLSGRLSIWGERRTITWSGVKWKRELEKELWHYNAPPKTTTIYKHCW